MGRRMCPIEITKERSARQARTVKIASIGEVTIGDYERNTEISDPEVLTDAEQPLLIDQSKHFNFMSTA